MRKPDSHIASPFAPSVFAAWLPMLASGLAAYWSTGLMRLAMLLATQALAAMAASHALGYLRGWGGADLARRLIAQLLLTAGFVLGLWLLLAWPAAAIEMAPSLGAVLVFSLVLALALASAWSWWPWCPLPLLARAEPSSHGSVGPGSRARQMLRAVSGRPDAYMLPVGLCQLGGSYLVLALSGLMPWPRPLTHAPAVLIAIFLVLPLLGLLLVWRCGQAARMVALPAAPEAPVRDVGSDTTGPTSLDLDVEDMQPGRREQALLDAARKGDTERALALLAADADPAVTPADGDPDRRSVLALSALLPDTRLLRALIARGANVNGDGRGMAPLLLAVRDGRGNRGDAVMSLLANGADARLRDGEHNTALHYAALADRPDLAAMLMDAGAELDAVNGEGCTPLAIACRAGHADMVDWLLEHGASPQLPGTVPALVAAAGASEDEVAIIERLLARRAAVDAIDVLDRSALLHAALSGHADSVSALLKGRANPNHADRHGTTALMEAARSGSNEVLSALAEAGADVSVRDNHGRDALTLACQSPRADADTVRILLDLGADPHTPGKDGRNALDHATGAGRWNLVVLLDPETPLPAAHCHDATPEAGADSPQHLLDALRFGHWAAVSGFHSLVSKWPAVERAELYLQLLGPEHATARRWLYEHDLDPAIDIGGQTLLGKVLDALPESVGALRELLSQGQSLAGRGLLARALARLGGAAAEPVLALQLLEHDGDLFGPDEDGMAPLLHAAARAMTLVVEQLLTRGCDPNCRDRNSQTPLHHVLKLPVAEALPLVRLLIRSGADPEAADASGETPLGQALDAGNEACVYWLRWRIWPLPGRVLAARDLSAAAACGDNEAVDRLVQLGFDVNTRDAQGATALLRACGHGHVAAARVLLDAGADLGLSTPAGATPLTAAVTARSSELVELLLARGAGLDQRLSGGATALLVGVALGHVDIVQQLLAAGADVAVRDDQGRTVLHAAAQFCFGSQDSLTSRRLLDVLLTHGADAAQLDHRGASALLFMLGAHARPGSPCNATHVGALLPVLLDAGAPVNAADDRGVTPLHACAMHALMSPARLLLARGADRAACDRHNRTAADVARILGYVDVAHGLAAH